MASLSGVRSVGISTGSGSDWGALLGEGSVRKCVGKGVKFLFGKSTAPGAQEASTTCGVLTVTAFRGEGLGVAVLDSAGAGAGWT